MAHLIALAVGRSEKLNALIPCRKCLKFAYKIFSKNCFLPAFRPVVIAILLLVSVKINTLKARRFGNLARFHPEMALFPLSVVLRGFPLAAYPFVRLSENPCAALLNEKIPHF